MNWSCENALKSIQCCYSSGHLKLRDKPVDLFSSSSESWQFFFFKIILFVYVFRLYIGSWLLCGLFSRKAVSWGDSWVAVHGLSLRCLLLLQSICSRHAGFGSRGSRLPSTGSLAVVHGLKFPVWNLPESGMEPASPLLTGGFLHHWATKEAPGVVHGNRILKAIRGGSVQAEFMKSSSLSLKIRAGNGGNIVTILAWY